MARQRDEGFGRRLVEEMERAGIRPTRLARDEGVDKGSVSRWRKGEIPGPLRLPRLATRLGVSVNWLKMGEGERTPAPAPYAGLPISPYEPTGPESLTEIYANAMTDLMKTAEESGAIPLDRALRWLVRLYDRAIMRRGAGENGERAAR